MSEFVSEPEAEPPEDQNSWRVTDTETTGMEKHDQVIEWAIVGPEGSWSHMFNPTVPIHCAARASHHITDEELKDKPIFLDWLAQCNGFEPFDNARYLIAHKSEFDVALLKQTGVPDAWFPEKTICTYRCSKHIWPDAPSHKNQALRYYFNLDATCTPEEKQVMQKLVAHRAPYDTIVTRGLLRLMLQEYTLYQLEQLTHTPFLVPMLNFGKHRGMLSEEVPLSYWTWLLGQGPERIEIINGVKTKLGFDEDMRYTAQYYLSSK
jgi:exodeoxyribonuclease X